MKSKDRFILILFFVVSISIFFSCTYDDNSIHDSYTSIKSFYAKNIVKSECFSIDASKGGSYTTSKGTVITIKPNSFLDLNSNLYKGNLTFEFKDIYTRSEMILSNIPAMTYWGQPLISAGMLYIKITGNDKTLYLDNKSPIVIQQPIKTQPGDSFMVPFQIGRNDSAGYNYGWSRSFQDTINYDSYYYFYKLYDLFVSAFDPGTWINTDNQEYFSKYPQTDLTIVSSQNPIIFGIDVFIVFKGINSVVNVYRPGSGNSFIYNYAPIGLTCNIVAVGTQGGYLYSCIKEVAITKNLSVPISLTITNTEEFRKRIEALNQ